MKTKLKSRAAIVLGIIVTVGSISGIALANHTWGPYHWARTANPFTVRLGDNLSSSWDPFLATASTDWSVSSVLDTQVVAGKSSSSCRATKGRVEVCNRKYGSNGWLGIASIWINGDHITQGTVKVNDTYFGKAPYNTIPWKNLVMCQEVGHTFGLGHQDENFSNANLDTCMDYTSNPASNQHPNQHDYDLLETIYAHLDSTNTSFATAQKSWFGRASAQELLANFDSENAKEWGQAIKTDIEGRANLFVRDLGNGNKVFTHVFWTEEATSADAH